MTKKIFLISLLVFNLFAILYLISPPPQISNLPQGVKSNLPGDTTQITNVSAYFTNLDRSQIINFYRQAYSHPFLVHLNHPPEKSKQIFVDTMRSYYLEELIIPFKESLFINGFEWEKDVFTKPEKRAANKLIYQDQTYSAKITLRTFPTPVWKRFLAFFFTEFTLLSCPCFVYSVFRRHHA